MTPKGVIGFSICVITGVEVQLPMMDLFIRDVRFEV